MPSIWRLARPFPHAPSESKGWPVLWHRRCTGVIATFRNIAFCCSLLHSNERRAPYCRFRSHCFPTFSHFAAGQLAAGYHTPKKQPPSCVVLEPTIWAKLGWILRGHAIVSLNRATIRGRPEDLSWSETGPERSGCERRLEVTDRDVPQHFVILSAASIPALAWRCECGQSVWTTCRIRARSRYKTTSNGFAEISIPANGGESYERTSLSTRNARWAI